MEAGRFPEWPIARCHFQVWKMMASAFVLHTSKQTKSRRSRSLTLEWKTLSPVVYYPNDVCFVDGKAIWCWEICSHQSHGGSGFKFVISHLRRRRKYRWGVSKWECGFILKNEKELLRECFQERNQDCGPAQLPLLAGDWGSLHWDRPFFTVKWPPHH